MTTNIQTIGESESLRNEARADLREFIRQVEERGELVRISGAHIDCEIGALFELSQEHLYPPTLLFENIPGFDPDYRIVSNVRNSRLLVGEISLEAVKAFRSRSGRRSEPIPPREVSSGPVLENILEGEAVDLLKFPAPKWHYDDGGCYIGTEDLVITKDPDSGWVNFGTYRVMRQGKTKLSIFIEPGKHGDMIRNKYWERGESCPIAVCVGQAPVLGSVASSPVLAGQSEYAHAGGRIGRPIEVVKAKITELPIPANAELVFEGYMPSPQEETGIEGPFGEWPGYYASGDRPEPVMHVKAIYHRNSPIIIGQPPVKPNYPGRQVNIAMVAALWNALEAAGVPEIRGVWKMLGGGNRFINVISIKQLHSGHAKMAGLVAAGCQPAAYMTRMIIVVDEDIDITNPAEVMWAMATRWDPKTQTDIIDGCYTGHIDPTLSPTKRREGDITTSRVIIYAVKPFHWKDKFPKVNVVSPDYAEEIRLKWLDKLDYLKK